MATAAELIAKISVQGLSQFTGDISSAQMAFDGFSSVVGTAIEAITVGLAAGSAAFVAFTTTAIEEAVKIERLTLTFGALAHSMDVGREKMAFLRDYARMSVNTFDDLAASAKRLESAGLNSGRFIRMIDILGGIIRPGSGGITQMADAFARIASGGNFGMAMRSLRQAGIGLGDLKAEGINVSGANKINATAEQMLTALEHIFQKKFGDMSAYLHSSMSVQLSNLQDAWNHLLDSFGKSWFPLMQKIMQSVGPFIDFLASSGEAEKLGKAFADAFGTIFGEGRGIQTFLAYFITTMELLPGVIANVGKVIINVARGIYAAIDGIVTGYVNTVGKTINGMINGIMAAIAPVIRIAQSVGLLQNIDTDAMSKGLTWTPYSGMTDMFGRLLAQVGGNDLMNLPDAFERRKNGVLADFDAYMRRPKAPATDPGEGKMFNDLHVKDTDNLAKIESHTARVASTMEHFKRYALGGGDRGKAGISTSEFYGHGSGSMTLNMGRAASHMEQAVQEIQMESWAGMRRAGLGN